MSDKNKVMVTTEHKGVFAGIYEGDPGEIGKGPVKLDDCRMCVYWDRSLHGIPGLASDGPNSQCRISPAVDGVHLTDVTGVFPIKDDAYKKWENEPWSA